ncbi:ACT domain-containing protein [Pontixanthobacter aquaemixtae]|uniref:ACT domain-containing protein n=1 Tax=Pontixanthobacter aquaemixtae TaxID=1958940 RepID=A0A844ZNQ4_9SPHN|nr:ACT domain-containing protein [Pontixanthobacter aquaemixtae]MXO89343.1 ACT domain-containing protein [Pontixanthobacter aquaemixtae]
MGSDTIKDTSAMIAEMDPLLDPAQWCFVSASDQGWAFALMPHALSTFREEEGLSLIVSQEAALEAGIEADPYCRIKLRINSALDGVGLTAAVSAALADARIACNIVAAYHHDHVFVPAGRAEEALALLIGLSRDKQTIA